MTDNYRMQYAHAFELSKALSELHNLTVRIEVLSISDGVARSTKKMLKDMLGCLDAAKRRFKDAITPETYNKIVEGLMNDEHAMQIDNMITMYMSLPEGIRSQEEDRVTKLAAIYAKKEEVI